MEYRQSLDRHRQVLAHLNGIPRKILSVHGLDNLTEFVLHDLCGEDCFNLQRAVYLVENTPFNCLKGVTGYSRHEAYQEADHWDNPQGFSSHMLSQPLNKNVRDFQRSCMGLCNISADQVKELAVLFGIERPSSQIWSLKHDNCGLLLFETPADEELVNAYMADALYLLSFCPVF